MHNCPDFPPLTSAMMAVFIFLPGLSLAQRSLVYPCVDFEAIRWVRDSTFCDQYYICHFGQPLAMPACPAGQVWSNGALNCVPFKSRWDDCNVELNPTVRTKSLNSRNTYNYVSPTKENIHRKSSPTKDTTNNVIISVKQLQSPQRQMKEGVSKLLSENIKNPQTVKDQVGRKNPLYYAGVPEEWHNHEGHGLSTWKPGVHIPESTWTTPSTHHRHVIWTPAPQNPTKNVKTSKGLYRLKVKSNSDRLNSALRHYNINSDHQCLRQPDALFPHPQNCHWYINCSLSNLEEVSGDQHQLKSYEDTGEATGKGFMLMEPFRVRQAGVFVWECRYPQLFDDVTGRCREFINVNCQSRFEPVDQCEYSARQCSGGRCIPCERRFGRCRGRENGVYPLHPDKWTPVFVTCYQQRNIAQDECKPPTPIFSPERMDCVTLFDVPKEHGGFLPDCSTRPDGYYPDEQGRCAIFFRCALGHFRGYDECPPGSVFDPAIPACQPFSFASQPCGEGQAPLCGGKQDGLYADPYGRCTHYFQCKQGVFQQYFTCDLGIFDPLTQRCVIAAELTVRPCGLQPSPCEALPTGLYPDQATGCKHFIECNHGNMITNGTCDSGTVFSAVTGRCDAPENAPPPCGVSTTCIGRPDGRYPALTRGCSFFYECYHGEFISLRRCTAADGGFFFNPETGTCDYPQNICPPCGYRWWGCPRTYQL